MVVDIKTAEGKIIEWKSHILRTINQDKARTQTLHDLQTGDILLIMDWAMKFLPLAFREKQRDWYGQKGINWHVSVCIYKDEDLNLKVSTCSLIFFKNQCSASSVCTTQALYSSSNAIKLDNFSSIYFSTERLHI